MRFSTSAILPVSLLASVVSAAHYDVTVGKGGELKFYPETIDAKKGDTVTYHFFARNHSVIESSFSKPCQPLANGGIFSTFVPNESRDIASPTSFTIVVKDEKPTWIYCGQTVGNHCQSGMVHAINAPKYGNTFEEYKKLAAKADKPSISPFGGPTGGLLKVKVQVGLNGALTYQPNDIKAVPGTVVEFTFNPRNHTVTESSFSKPCLPLDNGFSSGYVATTEPGLASFLIEVKDTKPIWFYCGQVNGNHCQSGMVGAINAPSSGSNTLGAFTELAKKAPPPSIIPAKAPLRGLLFVKDTLIKQSNLNGGNAINVDAILAHPDPSQWHNKPHTTTLQTVYSYPTGKPDYKPQDYKNDGPYETETTRY